METGIDKAELQKTFCIEYMKHKQQLKIIFLAGDRHMKRYRPKSLLACKFSVYICYSPAGRSVLGKTVPDVLDTARGRRPRAVSKTEGTVFPNTDRPSAGE